MIRSITRLRIERLESRLAPAVTTQYVGGNLRVFGDAAANVIILDVSSTGVAVTGDSNALGIFKVTGSVHVDAGNGNNAVTVNLATNLPGNLTILTGQGLDQVAVASTTAAAIPGMLRIDTGAEPDMCRIGSELGTINIGSVNLAGGPSIDDFFELGRVTVAGNITAVGTNTLLIGTPNIANGFAVVHGSVFASNADGLYNSFGFFGDATVDGNVSYIGSPGADFPGLFWGAKVNGNMTLALGGGDNIWGIDNSTLGGSLNVIAGSGNDWNLFNAGAVINGNVNLNLGDGDNLIHGDPGTTVGGYLFATAGSGNDLVSLFDGSAGFATDVGGPMTLSLGNGDNTLILEGSVGGLLTYIGGVGNDSVEVLGSHANYLIALLGAGNDTFTFAPGASVGGAFLSFGSGNVSFDDGGNAIVWPMTIIGL